jgi:hypothetical protein
VEYLDCHTTRSGESVRSFRVPNKDGKFRSYFYHTDDSHSSTAGSRYGEDAYLMRLDDDDASWCLGEIHNHWVGENEQRYPKLEVWMEEQHHHARIFRCQLLRGMRPGDERQLPYEVTAEVGAKLLAEKFERVFKDDGKGEGDGDGDDLMMALLKCRPFLTENIDVVLRGDLFTAWGPE